MDADVIVIGAGAAGLAAALRLAEASLEVIVLEARDRIGGRVLQAESLFASGAAELGAEFIHGTAPYTTAFLRAAGAKWVGTGDESWTCGPDGRLRKDDDGFQGAFELLEGARSLPHDESLENFLRRFDENESMREPVRTARMFAEGFDAADPVIASAQAIAQEWSSGVDFTSARPLGGYAPLFGYLCNACAGAGVRTYRSTAARRIAWQHGAVSVEAHAAGGASTFRARSAVVTLPVGVLRDAQGAGAVVFDPGLPAAKRDALAKIEMGDVVKVVLAFRTAFWENIEDGRYRDAAFFHCAGLPFAAYWTQAPVRSNLVVAWAGGPQASALGEIPEPELSERARGGFGSLVGDAAGAERAFERTAFHDWSRDPFSRGAYSYVAVGGGDARAQLAAPLDDTIFFAGEATAAGGEGGTVNGAFETGERAAREIARALGTTVRG